jgi:hypothetical protein
MTVYIINEHSTKDEIEEFYSLYVESFPKLCVHESKQIIDLSEYLTPKNDIDEFMGDVNYLVETLEITIFYTYNEEVLTSIAFVETDNINNCYAIIKFLCGNIDTREIKIDGKSQGHYLLDYLFQTYKDYVILIEPATPALIPYYTKYKKPNFPYTGKNRIETHNFLIYGNLTRLKEICFEKIFNSMRIIKKLKENLKFKSLEDLYNMTSDLVSLKEKLHHQLVFLIRTKQLNRTSYEELNKLIDEINYYDIDDIIITSRSFDSRSMAIGSISSGGKKSKGIKQMKKCKHKTQKRKKGKRTYYIKRKSI